MSAFGRRRRELGQGFLYLISRLGVTGAREVLAADAEVLARRVRAVTDMPLALGFGISRPEHVAAGVQGRPTPRLSAVHSFR